MKEGNRDLPDEEGTESDFFFQRGILELQVTEIFPMKRELKESTACASCPDR